MDQRTKAWEIVEKDRDALYIGNLNTVEFDLNLPNKGQFGSDITWESSHERFISIEGKVLRPTYGMGDRLVNLYATFSYEDASVKKTYEVRILEEANKLQVSKIYPVYTTIEAGQAGYVPQVAVVETLDGDIIPHPVVWEENGKVFFEEEGKYQIHGVLTGTSYEVVAEITVVNCMEVEQKDNTPKLLDMKSAIVRLSEGSAFYECQERMHQFLLKVNDDQMLYNFRFACGLDTKGAPIMEGWDAPESQLRGHTTGHYLSGLALCYHATGDKEIKEKIRYMVESLAKCQNAFSKIEGIQSGFLSGYSEEQFDQLEQFTVYPIIWAPYYTLHKIFAGLIDCYEYAECETALEIAVKLGRWTWNRLSKLTYETRAKMWSMYIAGEYGGMNEVMAKLYQITGEDEFLKCARLFDNDKLFYPLTQKIDALSTMHENQHVPQIIGAMEVFKATGEAKYYEIADTFWHYVTSAHIYATGGSGDGEMFHEANKIGALLNENTEESCATYNMLKLSGELFAYNPDAKYMHFYEKAMTNHTLATLDKKVTGESTYFLPLGPGMKREFLFENSCCHGTGMESHFKYGEHIYYYEENTLGVNLFIPSELTDIKNGIYAKICADENLPEKVRIHVQGNIENLKIRLPYWTNTCKIIVDGKMYQNVLEEYGYLKIEVKEAEEHVVELEFACEFHIHRTPDVPEMAAVSYGPYILAALEDKQEFIKVSFDEESISQQMKQTEIPMEFECDGIRWIPLYRVDQEAYHVYVVCEK